MYSIDNILEVEREQPITMRHVNLCMKLWKTGNDHAFSSTEYALHGWFDVLKFLGEEIQCALEPPQEVITAARRVLKIAVPRCQSGNPSDVASMTESMATSGFFARGLPGLVKLAAPRSAEARAVIDALSYLKWHCYPDDVRERSLLLQLSELTTTCNIAWCVQQLWPCIAAMNEHWHDDAAKTCAFQVLRAHSESPRNIRPARSLRTHHHHCVVAAWHQHPLVPQPSELQMPLHSILETLPRVPRKKPFPSFEGYAKCMFMLLRADLFAPLCEAISDLVGGASGERVYTSVRCVGAWYCGATSGVFLRFGNAKLKESHARLLSGNLLCLSADRRFEKTIWATVARREWLDDGVVGVQLVVDKADHRDGNMHEEMLHRLLDHSAQQGLFCVESPVFYPAYGPSLARLRDLHGADTPTDETENEAQRLRFPLARAVCTECHTRPQPPDYLRNGVTVDIGCMTPLKTPRRVSVSEAIRLLQVPEATVLDHSQAKAVQQVLKSKVAVIQGPPGCGKTFTGARLVTALSSVQDAGGSSSPPILVVTYKNHALDSFLEAITKFEPRVARIGGGMKDEFKDALGKYRIFDLGKEHRMNSPMWRTAYRSSCDTLFQDAYSRLRSGAKKVTQALVPSVEVFFDAAFLLHQPLIESLVGDVLHAGWTSTTPGVQHPDRWIAAEVVQYLAGSRQSADAPLDLMKSVAALTEIVLGNQSETRRLEQACTRHGAGALRLERDEYGVASIRLADLQGVKQAQELTAAVTELMAECSSREASFSDLVRESNRKLWKSAEALFRDWCPSAKHFQGAGAKGGGSCTPLRSRREHQRKTQSSTEQDERNIEDDAENAVLWMPTKKSDTRNKRVTCLEFHAPSKKATLSGDLHLSSQERDLLLHTPDVWRLSARKKVQLMQVLAEKLLAQRRVAFARASANAVTQAQDVARMREEKVRTPCCVAWRYSMMCAC